MKKHVLKAVSTVPSLIFVIAAVVLFVVFVSTVTGQKPAARRPGPGDAKLRVWIPSGIMGGNYWIYLNGHLKSSPPYEAPGGNFNMVFLADGSGWEAWTSEGLLTSSKRYDGWLNPYLASGDRYKVFQKIEYGIAPGKHTLEVMVSAAGMDRSLSPVPFAITRKYEVVVRPGQTVDLYTEVPSGWNSARAPIPPRWASPCSGPSFNLKAMQDDFLAWGRSYQNDPLVKLLHGGRASFKIGSPVLELDLPGGPREFDGQQLEQLVGEINLRFSNIRFDHNEIDYCKSRFPQYSKAFDEYHKTISFIDGDLASLQKLATDLKSNR